MKSPQKTRAGVRGRVPARVVVRLLLTRAERVFASARLQAAAADGYPDAHAGRNPMRVWHSRGCDKCARAAT
ncbi:hypothetical protein VZT92_010276 [Zoarces viviparus]|uniref:Uncharacterized protein n=1 Tax=Zoarces viviparus TaxID=48416 RepID=A0AAW1FEC1_ZOAVI